jgi:hypothetical protein
MMAMRRMSTLAHLHDHHDKSGDTLKKNLAKYKEESEMEVMEVRYSPCTICFSLIGLRFLRMQRWCITTTSTVTMTSTMTIMDTLGAPNRLKKSRIHLAQVMLVPSFTLWRMHR